MTTTSDLRNAIVAKVSAVANVGQVHAYERYTAQISKLKEFYLFENQIRGWNLRRVSFTKRALADALFMVRSSWELRGFMSLDDAASTELTFDALTDLIQAKLTNDPTFGGLGAWPENYELKASLEPVMFCGILCHGATINFDTMHHEVTVIDETLDDFTTLDSQFDVEPSSGSTEHAKWLTEPPDYSTSKPEFNTTVNLEE